MSRSNKTSVAFLQNIWLTKVSLMAHPNLCEHRLYPATNIFVLVTFITPELVITHAKYFFPQINLTNHSKHDFTTDRDIHKFQEKDMSIDWEK